MSAVANHFSVQNLESLSTDAGYYQDQSSYMNIRDKAIQQAAEALGMQSGLANESKQITIIINNLCAESFSFKHLAAFSPIIKNIGII